jgi:cysteine-rich repeat protein
MGIRSVALAAVCLALAAGRADAAFHEMKIVEVFPGTPAAPQAQYIVLQMYSGGQNFVSGHTIKVFNAGGTEIGSVTFSASVGSGANQAKILIATTQAQSFFNVTPDLVLTTALPVTGGKVCFETIDCVAWGNYSPTESAVGTPWNRVPPTGLVPTRALVRRLDISGSATALDGSDDTNNSLADFVLATPAPVNNAGQAGTIPSSTCPNNAVEGIEGCDDNNSVAGDGCSSTCVLERCGDGMTNNVSETCDDANVTNGDGCDNNCKITACGNGVITGTEVCDDGNAISGDGCDSNCKVTGCGNGVMTTGETCDDGNLTSGDGCDSNCTVTGCGNGIVTAGEFCDPPNGSTCSSSCQQSCTLPAECADTNPCTTNERCDNQTCAVDPTPTNDNEPCTTDGCDANGVFHTALTNGTTCTLSGNPGARALCVAGTCRIPTCGDGYTDTAAPSGAEQCDDGNTVNTDACTNSCKLAACGDAIVASGEECDDGNTSVNDGCSGTCFLERCGDLLQQTSEACDDGNALPDDGCSATCAIESCGDSVVQLIEQCDDGNLSPNDGCSAQCTTERCGDGNQQAGEDCDDGNTVDGDTCSATCTTPDSGGCCNTARAPSPAVFVLGLGVLTVVLRRRRPKRRL